MFVSLSLVVLVVISTAQSQSYDGQYVAKKVYVLQEDPKLNVHPRARRDGGSFAFSSSSSSNGNHGGGVNLNSRSGVDPGSNSAAFNPGFIDPEFFQNFFTNIQKDFKVPFAGPIDGSAPVFTPQSVGYKGPILFSRMGEGVGNGVQVSGSAQGEHGAFSSSSSSVDSDGKVKYSIQSGKY